MIIYAQVTPQVHAMRKVRHIKDLRRLMAAALFTSAERVSDTTWKWNVAGHCSMPVAFTLEGRAPEWWYKDRWGDVVGAVSSAHPHVRPTNDGAYGLLYIDVTAKCRRCTWCLKRRASEWSIRARREIGAASRTWFGTLTLRPEEHFRAACRAEARSVKRGVAWAELTDDQKFVARHNAISTEITKWLKRIRKESGAYLRYCIVAEAHKSGLPHYHILVHERWLGGSIGERTLRKQWNLGFSKFNLVNDAYAAWYVAKYLSKASAARVRASALYGKHGL